MPLVASFRFDQLHSSLNAFVHKHEHAHTWGTLATTITTTRYLSEQRTLDLSAQPSPIVVGTYTNPSYLEGTSAMPRPSCI